MIITSLTTAPPETGTDCMRGSAGNAGVPSHAVRASLRYVCTTALWAVRTSRDKAQGQTGHRPVATAFEAQRWEFQRRKIEKSERSRLSTMLENDAIPI